MIVSNMKMLSNSKYGYVFIAWKTTGVNFVFFFNATRFSSLNATFSYRHSAENENCKNGSTKLW